MRHLTLKASLAGLLVIASAQSRAAVEDDPLLVMTKIDQLEIRDSDEGNVTAWEGSLWMGKDYDKFWIKTEGERTSEGTETAEIQLLYGRAVDPNWDLVVGLKHDAYPEPSRDWFAIGFSGVAPYFFEVDSSLFIGENGQANLRFQAEYELMLTQKWVLSPEIEMNWFSEADEVVGIGKGFANLEAGLRLRYEINRQLAPYIGINHERLLGDTKDLAKSANAETDATQVVGGVAFWF
ncbi:MAG: copper resistance protein B [Planctomycetota bacterium]|jgi:copper resistance protein B